MISHLCHILLFRVFHHLFLPRQESLDQVNKTDDDTRIERCQQVSLAEAKVAQWRDQ